MTAPRAIAAERRPTTNEVVRPAAVAPIAAPPVAGIVLAAGWSSRMGAFKPLLPFGRITVVEHVVATLRAAGIAEVLVVTGHNAAALAPVLARLGVVTVHNHDFDRGMYSSIRAGIAAVSRTARGALVLPVDIPLVRAATLAAVAAAGLETGAAVVHPTFRGRRGHPPFLARRLFRTIIEGDGEGGLRRLIETHVQDTVELPVIDRGILPDMDTPADFVRVAETVPGRAVAPDLEECEAMLEAALTPEPVRRHCRAVAGLATVIAERLAAQGLAVDVDVVRAGALLHDIAKGHPHHAELGAALVRGLGFPEVAAVVERHMQLNLVVEAVPDERAIVFLADKLIKEDRRITLDARFAGGLGRFAGDPAALAGARHRKAEAEAVLAAVESLIDLPEPEAELGAIQAAGFHSAPTPVEPTAPLVRAEPRASS